MTQDPVVFGDDVLNEYLHESDLLTDEPPQAWYEYPKIVGDATVIQPSRPETWVEERSTLSILGGIPNIIVEDTKGDQFRHSADGRLWIRV